MLKYRYLTVAVIIIWTKKKCEHPNGPDITDFKTKSLVLLGIILLFSIQLINKTKFSIQFFHEVIT